MVKFIAGEALTSSQSDFQPYRVANSAFDWQQMETTAIEESRPCSVLFRLFILSLFIAENDRYTDAVVTGTISMSLSDFVTDCILQLSRKKNAMLKTGSLNC